MSTQPNMTVTQRGVFVCTDQGWCLGFSSSLVALMSGLVTATNVASRNPSYSAGFQILCLVGRGMGCVIDLIFLRENQHVEHGIHINIINMPW